MLWGEWMAAIGAICHQRRDDLWNCPWTDFVRYLTYAKADVAARLEAAAENRRMAAKARSGR